MCDGEANNSVPHVQSGQIKAYAFEEEHRSSILPEVPTAKEKWGFQVFSWGTALIATKATLRRFPAGGQEQRAQFLPRVRTTG